MNGYETNKTIYIPLSVKKNFIVKLIANFKLEIFELNVTNNELVLNQTFQAVYFKKKLNLTVSILNLNNVINFRGGSAFNLKYVASNNGSINLPFTYWTDSVYLTKSKPIDQIINDGILLNDFQRASSLDADSSLILESRVFMPNQNLSNLFIVVVFDKNNVFDQLLENVIITTSDKNYIIEEGPKADLRLLNFLINSNYITSGSYLNGSYKVLNYANYNAFSYWYDTIYLSLDAVIDPFDKKLFISRINYDVSSNETYTNSFSFYLPFDLDSSYYYLILSVANTNVLDESTNNNNVIKTFIFIRESQSVDLSIISLQTNKLYYKYEEDINLDWGIVNNGSLTA